MIKKCITIASSISAYIVESSLVTGDLLLFSLRGRSVENLSGRFWKNIPALSVEPFEPFLKKSGYLKSKTAKRLDMTPVW